MSMILVALIRLYRQDPRFTDLAAQSQQAYDYHLRTIEAWSERAGHPPITTIERKHVRAFARSMSTTPGKAQQVIGVLRTLFAFAMDEGELAANHATNMRLKSNPPRHQVLHRFLAERLIDAENPASMEIVADHTVELPRRAQLAPARLHQRDARVRRHQPVLSQLI